MAIPEMGTCVFIISIIYTNNKLLLKVSWNINNKSLKMPNGSPEAVNQTIQCSKDKVKNDKQWVTKHYKENKKIEHHNNRHVAAAIMVQRSIGVRNVIAFVNTSRQMYLSWQLCVYRHLRKFSWICWLGKKMIYGYIYRVNIGSIVSLRRTPFIGSNTTSLAPAAAMPECLFFVFCFFVCFSFYVFL